MRTFLFCLFIVVIFNAGRYFYEYNAPWWAGALVFFLAGAVIALLDLWLIRRVKAGKEW